MQKAFQNVGLGLVVQLVRIPACHSGGRGFESRPDRRSFPCIKMQTAIRLFAFFVFNILTKLDNILIFSQIMLCRRHPQSCGCRLFAFVAVFAA